MFYPGVIVGDSNFASHTRGIQLPANTVVPDYADGGLFGLIGSIARFLDGAQWRFEGVNDDAEFDSHSDFDSGAHTDPCSAVVVFLLIDGLGDNFLQTYGEGSALLARRRRRITSVFPSTTASAVTTTLTGIAPASHGLTGWFIRDERFGGVLAPLPMTMRAGGRLGGLFSLRRLFPYDTLFQNRSRPSVLVSPHYIAWSPFSQRHSRGAAVLAYDGVDGMLEAVLAAVARSKASGGGYVHAYYPEFDALSHEFGSRSTEAISEFWRIDAMFAQLCERLAGRGVDVVVSADHGFIDSPEERFVRLDAFPEALAMLAEPLWGERRAAFCELREGAEADFGGFVRDVLADKAVLVRSADLVEQGFFGPGVHHPRLRERTGSHTLLMEPGWTIWDPRPDEPLHTMLGVHGGLTPDEMWVPLIHVRC